MNLKLGTKGQLSVVNLIGLLVIIMVFATTADMITYQVGVAQNSTDASTDMILALILPLMAVGIILTIFTYERPYYQQPGA